MNDVFNVLRGAIAVTIEIGSLSVVDEGMYAYYGVDMEEEGIAINMEGKPHPYDLLNRILSQSLLLTRKPVIIDMESYWPHKFISQSNILHMFLLTVDLLQLRLCLM